MLEDRRMLAVTFDWATIGNPGNAGELSGAGAGGYGPDAIVGGVDYTYRISKYEVTNGQYIEFLNSVASQGDPNGLYNTNMAGTYGGIARNGSGTVADPYIYSPKGGDDNWLRRPVNYVSPKDAMRFTNWLENGQGTGDTETGVYTINAQNNEVRKSNATYFLPTENEWYKAAYHKNDGVTGNYWDYPTQSNIAPGYVNSSGNLSGTGTAFVEGVTDPGNYATWDGHDGADGIGSPYYMTSVGEWENSESPYGTFDQGGNVWEWNETIVTNPQRGVRGGGWNYHYKNNLHAGDRHLQYPTYESDDVGFRVASAFTDDIGDTLATSADLGILGTVSSTSRQEVIGDGAHGARDVDFYEFILADTASVEIQVTAYQGQWPPAELPLDSYLRLFDASGSQIAADDDYQEDLGGGVTLRGSKIATELPAGTYYAGVSGYPNKYYSPYVPGSGVDAGLTGPYTLSVSVAGGTLPPLSGDIRTVAGVSINASSYTPNPDGSWTANGAIVLNDTVEVIGTLTFNPTQQTIQANGKFWLRNLPVLGDVKLYEGALSFNGQPISDSLFEAVSDFKVLGMEVSLDNLELVSGAARIQGGISLPSSLGSGGNSAWKLEITGSDYIEIGPGIPGGFRFSGATITVPDTKKLSFHGMPFKNQGVTFRVASNELQIRGQLELPTVLGGTTIDLLTDARHIAISNYDGGLPELEIVGELRIDGPIGLDGGFSLENLVFQIDTPTQELQANGTLRLPSGYRIDVGVGFKEGWFNYISVVVSNLEYAVVYGPPPAPVPIVYLQDVGAYVDELAPGPPPFVLGGNIAFTAGPQIHVQGNDYYLVRLDLAAEYDTGGRFTGSGQVLLGGGANPYELASATVVIDDDYGLYVQGNLNYASVLDVSATMHLGLDRDLYGSFEGNLHAPGWLGGWSLGSAKGYGQYLDDGDQSNDFLLFGGSVLGAKKAIEFNLNTGDIDWFANYSQLKEIVVPAPPAAAIVAAGVSAPYDLPLPVGLDSAVFQLQWDTGDTDLNLTDPSGTTYTPANVDSYPDVSYYKDPVGHMAVFEVLNPQGGTWQALVSETSGIGGYTITSRKSSNEPVITLQTPQLDSATTSVDITWVDEDTDSDAAISLFYDTDRTGADGVLIASGISENDTADSYTWDTTGLPAGSYYVYAVIDDGANVPVVSYSTGRVTVTDPDAPPMVTGLNAPAGTDTTVRLTWDASVAPDLDHYLIRLASNAAGEQYEQVVAAVEADAVVDGLVTGETYRATVAAVDTDGHIGQDSDPVVVVVGGQATVPPEVGQWGVFAQPGTLYAATVPGDSGDVFNLIAGPAGATLDPGTGLFEWNVPAGADGWQEVLAHGTHGDGTKSVYRFTLYSDSSDPQLVAGAPQAEAVDDTTINVTAPDGRDASGVLLYQLQRNGTVVGGWQTSPAFTDTGLLPNMLYEYRVQAKDSSPDGRVSTWSAPTSIHTMAVVPGAPSVGNPTANSIQLFGLEPDGNPASTEYAVFNSTDGLYVAGDGTLVVNALWQTADAWSNVTIGGLQENAQYSIQALARNQDGFETSLGPAATAWTLRETVPPIVTSFDAANPLGVLAIEFSEPVAIALKDVSLVNATGTPVDLTTAQLVYTPSTNTATIDLQAILTGGDYTVTLDGDSVQDLASNLLDGDANGAAGGDFVRTFRVDPTPGDMDLDGDVDFDDIDDFVLGLNDAAQYEATYGVPPALAGDTNADGDLDFDDIDNFVGLLIGSVLGPRSGADAQVAVAAGLAGDVDVAPAGDWLTLGMDQLPNASRGPLPPLAQPERDAGAARVHECLVDHAYRDVARSRSAQQHRPRHTRRAASSLDPLPTDRLRAAVWSDNLDWLRGVDRHWFD